MLRSVFDFLGLCRRVTIIFMAYLVAAAPILCVLHCAAESKISHGASVRDQRSQKQSSTIYAQLADIFAHDHNNHLDEHGHDHDHEHSNAATSDHADMPLEKMQRLMKNMTQAVMPILLLNVDITRFTPFEIGPDLTWSGFSFPPNTPPPKRH